MNKLIVITSLFLLTSSVFADDEAGYLEVRHDDSFGQVKPSHMMLNGNCEHFHSRPEIENGTGFLEPEN